VSVFKEFGTSTAAVAAAAHLKQVRLMVGTDKRKYEVQTQLSIETREMARMPQVKWMKKRLRPYMERELKYSGLGFSVYNGQPVVIQWKKSDSTQWAMHEEQIKFLTALLASIDDPSFLSLPCQGHYHIQDKARFGIVYATPPGASETSSPSWEKTSLYDLFDTVPHVSLGRRIAIAKAIAEAVLQLHTAGWLHKNLRSENIVFFTEKGSPASKAVVSDPYIFGYDLARPDTQAGAAYTQMADIDLARDLYRHPKAQGHDREAYQKRFDMYALGCLLVELIFWKRLVHIQAEWTGADLVAKLREAAETNKMPEDWKLPDMMDLFANEEAVVRMDSLAGGKFLRAAKACTFIEPAGEGEEASLEDEIDAVEVLKSCRV